MKNILLPTDFSENSWKAVIYALSFFKNYPCNFYILHVAPAANYPVGDIGVISTLQTIDQVQLADTKKKLNNQLKKIKKIDLSKMHNFVPIASSDYFIDAIRNQIEEKKIDLVLMGTKGASGFKKAIIGSNTGDVITRIKIPLLAIPENAVFKEPKEVAFPTDYNVFYQTKILNDLTEYLHMYTSSLRIVRVARKDEKLRSFQIENKEYLDNSFIDFEHSFHKITNRKVADGIQCFIESRGIDMLIMVAKDLNLFRKIMFKPTVEEISYHTHVPFLVLHE